MRLHLGGHLNYFDELQRTNIEIAVAEEEILIDLLVRLKIPIEEIYLVSINGEIANLEQAKIQPDDYVQLFPPIGGG